jgi:hypothetical protein
MKIPSVTQERTTPAATVLPPASPPDDAAPSPQLVVELPGEDGETVSIVAPPPDLLVRLQAEAAARTDDGIATADELARQLAAAQPTIHAVSAQSEPVQAVDTSLPGAGKSTAIPVAEAASPDTAATGQPPAVPPTVDDRQPFKMVLRLKPVTGNRWHATIGIGRDGCDPCWEGSDVDDWRDALDSVLGVHAAAEARWADQPRNPRPAVPGASGSVTAVSVPVAAGSTPTKGRAKGKDGATSKAPPSAPPPAAAASAPPPTTDPAHLPPVVPAADPAPAAGVEKLTLF